MHVGKGRKNPLHVDYIFLGACLGYIQDAMTEAILSHPRLELEQKIAIVKAVGKVIWIQNDLMAKWHTEEGREFADPFNDEEVQAEAREPEGYINGHKVLGRTVGNDDDNSIDRPSSRSSRGSGTSVTSLGRTAEQVQAGNEFSKCPFSGIGAANPDMGAQRATPWRPPRSEPQTPPAPSGIPRLHVIDGRTVCKENLGPNPFH